MHQYATTKEPLQLSLGQGFQDSNMGPQTCASAA
jgi:hypothetical protein